MRLFEDTPKSESGQSGSGLSPGEQKLYELLVPQNRAEAIQLHEFADLYGEEVVRRDEQVVRRKEEKIQKELVEHPELLGALRRSELLEAMINEQIEQSNWLGQNANVIVPSRYDDLENKTDGIVEFEEETGQSYLALGYDVTKSKLHLKEKFQGIKSKIDRGTLSNIKYFKSKNFRGELREVPHVVIGADHKTMEEIADLITRFKLQQKSPAKTEAQQIAFRTLRNRLEAHPLQFQILQQMRAQLKVFGEYAERRGEGLIAAKYKTMLKTIEMILKAKGRQTAQAHSDEVDTMIHEEIIQLEREIRAMA